MIIVVVAAGALTIFKIMIVAVRIYLTSIKRFCHRLYKKNGSKLNKIAAKMKIDTLLCLKKLHTKSAYAIGRKKTI